MIRLRSVSFSIHLLPHDNFRHCFLASTPQKTILLTLGRLPVCLHLARALHAQGWRVVVAEPFRFHLCQLSNSVSKSIRVIAPTVDANAYLDALHRVIDEEAVSLVIPVSEESMFVAALKPRLAPDVQMLCMPQDRLLQLHDKYEFFRLAERLGVAVPETALAHDAESGFTGNNANYVVKPRLSCAGKGVRFLTEPGSLTATEKSHHYIVQQKISGASCCSFSIADNGVVVQSVCYRSLLTSGSVSVCFEEIPAPDGLATSIEKVIAETNYTGMISFDFMQDDEGCWRAIECNPRATSGLHLLTHHDLYHALLDARIDKQRVFSGKLQEFWSCLACLEGQLLKGKLNRSGWRYLFIAKDINWLRSDKKPFLLMSFVVAPMLFKAIRLRRPVTELLMDDVGWHDVQ